MGLEQVLTTRAETRTLMTAVNLGVVKYYADLKEAMWDVYDILRVMYLFSLEIQRGTKPVIGIANVMTFETALTQLETLEQFERFRRENPSAVQILERAYDAVRDYVLSPSIP